MPQLNPNKKADAVRKALRAWAAHAAVNATSLDEMTRIATEASTLMAEFDALDKTVKVDR